MLAKVIDSFDTLYLPELKLPVDVFDGVKLTKTEQLNEDLQAVASSIVTICKTRIRDESEDIDLKTLQDIAKITLDVQKAFFDNKQTNVQVNNIQNNISNSQLNHFKGIMQNEI